MNLCLLIPNKRRFRVSTWQHIRLCYPIVFNTYVDTTHIFPVSLCLLGSVYLARNMKLFNDIIRFVFTFHSSLLEIIYDIYVDIASKVYFMRVNWTLSNVLNLHSCMGLHASQFRFVEWETFYYFSLIFPKPAEIISHSTIFVIRLHPRFMIDRRKKK